eukprot:PhM_4_TR17420/c5_g1_i1/m.78055
MRSFKTPQLIALFFLVLATSFTDAVPRDRVLLTDVKALTFQRGAVTTARRGRPIPQMTCTSSRYLCDEVDLPSVQCRNVGDAGGGDVQWACEASFPTGYRMGPISVNCEGYESPEDEHVLKGSCGLEYSVEVDKSSQRRPSHHHDSGRTANQYGRSRYSSHEDPSSTSAYGHSSSSSSRLSWLFYGFVAFGLYMIFFRRATPNQQPHAPGGGGRPPMGTGFGGGGSGGGSGGGGGGFRTAYSGPYTQTQTEYQQPQQQQQQQAPGGGGPGFLT